MRIFLITFDTNLIDPEQRNDAIAMNTLEYWNKLGLIHLLKTDTMEIEFQKCKNNRRQAFFLTKSKEFKEDYGVNLVDHSKYTKHLGGLFVNSSILDEISSVLFGRLDHANKNVVERKIRDAAHLNTHYMNDRDFFITCDGHFHNKEGILKQRFNINILYPKECVSFIEEYWKKDESEGLPISNPNHGKASIIIGTEVTHHLTFMHKDKKLLEVQNYDNKYFIVTANLYNREGHDVVEVSPERVRAKGRHCKVSCSYFHENQIGILIPVNKQLYSELYVHDSNELLLKAEVFTNGDLLLYSRIYDDAGNLLAYITKESFEYKNECFRSFYEEKQENGTVNMKLTNW